MFIRRTLAAASALATVTAVAVAARSDVLWRRAPAGTPGHIVVPATPEPRPSPSDPAVLRVCADPNNLPFSNERGEGFENRIAEVVSHAMGTRLEYYWQPQRRGFIRTTLNAGWCDVVMGVPAGFELAQPTHAYYRSTYVFVRRRSAGPTIRSLDDPRLQRLRIGVEMIGEDYNNPPALHALAARHLVANIRGYLVYGDYSTPNPPRAVIDAVADGRVDVAIAWGPLAGYFARRATVPLELAPVTPQRDGPGVDFTFDIAMAVRRHDVRLRDALDGVLTRRRAEIRAILADYGVPLAPMDTTS
jgi:mxaJ protein